MNIKNKLGCFVGIVCAFIILPLWLMMIFLVLRHIHATPLIWGLFIAYVPFTVIVSILTELMKNIVEDEKVKETIDLTVAKVKPKPVSPLVRFMRK